MGTVLGLGKGKNNNHRILNTVSEKCMATGWQEILYSTKRKAVLTFYNCIKEEQHKNYTEI